MIRSDIVNWRLIVLSGLLSYFPACAHTDRTDGASQTVTSSIVDPPERLGAPVVLIAMPTSPSFVEVRKSLVSEVQRSFTVRTLAVGPQTQVADIASAVETAKPVCVVLMNNTTINLYRQYQEASPSTPRPPAVLLMASFIEEVQTQIRRSTGIAYEVPGVTAFVHLRSVINTPINRVGVIYRPVFSRFVDLQKSLAAKEKVDLIAVSVPNNVTSAGVRDALRDLSQRSKVDAVWMLNDNTIVRDAEFVDDAWRTELNERRIPLIVGVANLVDPKFPLGALAVVPDLEALGLQAANLLYDLSENDWKTSSHPVELPLSSKTVVDIKLIQANFGLRPNALKHIDRALE
jgi:hypothetical protein